jgi:hypothetical protein
MKHHGKVGIMQVEAAQKFSMSPTLRILAAIVTGLWLLFLLLDIVAYLRGRVSSVTIYLKGAASCSCAVIALVAWKSKLSRPADLLRAIGFCLAFLGDVAVLLNTYKVLAAPLVFAIGGYLFIPALLLISVRNADLFRFLFKDGKIRGSELRFALYFYLPFILLLVVLGKSLAGVGLLGLGVGYGLCLVTLLWTGWAALRNELFPRPRAAMIAAGASLVFVMELVGLVYNLHIPGLEGIAFFATWILYVPGMLLMALA